MGSALFRRFRTLLIANRGEIACRIIRSARAMGLRAVAVYSEADRDALHVAMADSAVLLGPPRARDSYLNVDRLLAAARESGAEAIHPGYGFLSESDEFARRCAEANLVFVGPTAEMIEAMGSKSGAKALMEKAGVPLVPGYHGEAQDEATLAKAAETIGFPVLVKASAGGGGRGMRVVRAASELTAAIVSAKREAKAAFGDDRMLIEKYVDNPRHIEVQVVGDCHGNLVSLFERECTLQRRHQKVIEEAPSPTLDDKQRAAIGLAARKAAAAVKYVGAGTIEFVSDGRDFFFIEMNTRLQVEHPVTELVTGVDLVEWQLRVAFGEALPLKQDEIRLKGHAVEARVYAENPAKNFMPSVGRIRAWRLPEERGGLRIDAGYRDGSVVSPHYDAMLAKVIAYGESRDAALDRIVAALDETDVRGIVTNVSFLSALLSHADVRSNHVDTGFIERHLKELSGPAAQIGSSEIGAAVAAALAREMTQHDKASPWSRPGWMPGGARRRKLTFRDGEGHEHSAALGYGGNGMTLETADASFAFEVHPGGDRAFSGKVDADVPQENATAKNSSIVDSFLNGTKTRAIALWDDRSLYLRTPSGRFELTLVDPFGVDEDEHAGEDRIVAPLPGTVVALLAEEGALLEKGAPVLTLEVMKMEQTLRAPFAGTLKALKCKVGDIVQEGVELAEIEATNSE